MTEMLPFVALIVMDDILFAIILDELLILYEFIFRSVSARLTHPDELAELDETLIHSVLVPFDERTWPFVPTFPFISI